MEELRQQANDLLCYYAKTQNRLTQVGVKDTGSLVGMFDQLQQGLDAVAFEELEPAIEEVGRLVESLTRMQADLQIMRDLKIRVEKMRVQEGDSANAIGRRAA